MTQELKFFTQDKNSVEDLINHLLHLGLYTTDPGFWERASDDQVYRVSVYTGNLRGQFGVYAPRLDFDSGNVASLEDILAFNTKEKLWHFIRTLPDTMPDTKAVDPEDKAEEPARCSAPAEEEHSVEVTIFFPNGAEKTFSKVTGFELITPSGITIKYIEEVSGKRFHKEALFYTDNIAGYTKTIK